MSSAGRMKLEEKSQTGPGSRVGCTSLKARSNMACSGLHWLASLCKAITNNSSGILESSRPHPYSWGPIFQRKISLSLPHTHIPYLHSRSQKRSIFIIIVSVDPADLCVHSTTSFLYARNSAVAIAVEARPYRGVSLPIPTTFRPSISTKAEVPPIYPSSLRS